jgi:hypothetical protein
MLRTLLIATTLLTASGTALAHGDERYGRVVEVEPYFAISFGTPYRDGFRVLYESGGARYWSYSPDYPGRALVLPPRHEMRHVYRYRDYGRGWDDHRDGWRDSRWEHRRERRDHDD